MHAWQGGTCASMCPMSSLAQCHNMVVLWLACFLRLCLCSGNRMLQNSFNESVTTTWNLPCNTPSKCRLCSASPELHCQDASIGRTAGLRLCACSGYTMCTCGRHAHMPCTYKAFNKSCVSVQCDMMNNMCGTGNAATCAWGSTPCRIPL